MRKSVVCILFYCTVLLANNELNSVQQVIDHQAKKFISRYLTDDARITFGLSQECTAESVSFGNPIHMNTLSSEKLLSASESTPLESLSSDQFSYYVPVLFNGSVELLLSIHKYPGEREYKIGSIGHTWLAEQFSTIFKTWNSAIDSPIELYINYETYIHAFTLSKLPNKNLTIINPNASRSSFEYANLSTCSTAIAAMKQQLIQQREEK